MKTQQLGRSDLHVSQLAYGCMRISHPWDKALSDAERDRRATESVAAAVESGYTLYDLADVYGQGECETVFGRVTKANPSWRNRMIVATKCGCRRDPFRYDFSYEHITRSCEESLRRMQIETIDLYQLHRPDYLADPGEVCRAFCELKAAGKVRWFGLSNHSPSRLSMIQKGLPFPLVAHQVQISLLHQDGYENGTLDQCVSEKITPLAWAPVARGILAGGQPAADDPDGARKRGLVELMDNIAAEYGVGRDAIALAWLRRHPSRIIPILGSNRPDRIRSAVKAVDIELDRIHWNPLLVAARGKPLP